MIGPVSLKAQSTSQDSIDASGNSFFALPIVYYTPETRWAFGGAGIFTFRFKGEQIESRPSQLQFGAAYTQNKQILLYLPFRLFIQQEQYTTFGEIGYYKYNYFFFGIGNNEQQDFQENYGLDYPRVRINALTLIRPNWYLGLGYDFNHYQLRDLDPNGKLVRGNITGSQGGLISAPGISSVFDQRDNIFYPRSGIYTEVSLQLSDRWTGSDFSYQRFRVDFRKYWNYRRKHILALNTYVEILGGDPPFMEMALLGGNKRMRGYYEGRYRDKQLWMVQAEYRTALFWRLGLALFGGYGLVTPSLDQMKLDQLRYSYGAGLRVLLNKKEQIHIRLDAGFGANSFGYYLTIGEAF